VICSNCGNENRPGAKFCSECATPLATACPNCGTMNAPTAKFCSECATPLVAGARPAVAVPAPPLDIQQGSDAAVAERRLVTILFNDLVGFTPFSEGRDSEEVRETLSRYFEMASELIGRYGGTVEKFIGDAVMAVWGAPIAREDDAERAVRAGLELVAAVPSLGAGIEARCGVLTGEAAVTLGAANQGMVAGDIVNTAARLQSAAQPGTVLVGEATQRSASGSIVFEQAGEQTLKGKSSPVPAWRAIRVVAERGGRNRADTQEAPFVGRDEELRQLKELFHATVRERKPRLVSVIGPAGIGKSRLAWEFLKYVDGLLDTAWWHTGRSPAYGDGISFWALGEMVRRRAGLLEGDDQATSREKIAAIVREHVPDPEEQAWIEPALLVLLGIQTGVASDQLFAAWRTFFERLAQSNPVIMVFEDFHHADSGLLEFIDHLMQWTRGLPILVVTLSRPELLDRRPDWGAGIRTFSSIHLEPLPAAAMRALLAGLVPGIPTRAADVIVARADGVPLYAVETVRMLLAQGRIVLDDGAYRPTDGLEDLAVPESLTALIAARLDGLDPTDRALVEDAAVLGQSFTLAGLAAVSGVARVELEGRLRALVKRELLVLEADPRSPERGQYHFVQALIREVAYNTLARKDRKARHLAAARFFESIATDELAGGLAVHYLAAQRLAADEAEANALAAQARIALRGAAERADALGSYEQARVFLEQALEVTIDPAERADLHERALSAALNVLGSEPVLRHGEAVEMERRRTGDRAAIAHAVALHAIAIGTARNDPVASLALLERAWAEFSDLEETQAGVDLMLGFTRTYRSLADNERALFWVDRVLPVAERLGNLQSIARGLQGRGITLALYGRPREGVILLRGSHDLALANDFRDIEKGCRTLLTFYEQWGDPAAGLALGQEGLEIGRKLGSMVYGFQMIGNSAICALRVGEWDWALGQLEEWIEGEADDSYWMEFRIDRALFNAYRGRDTSADIAFSERVRAGVTDPQFESYELFARAATSLASGDLATALEQSERAATITDYFTPLAIPLAARAAVWAGDATAARRLMETPALARFSGPALDADRTRIRAGVAALEGNIAEAIGLYRESIQSNRGLGLAFDAALTGIDVATVLGAAERTMAEVAEWIDAARATLQGLDARPLLDRLEAATAPAASSPGATRTASREARPVA
jgi:class 3 adenylate cyclase/tetratricopeptide (TPR) repeat protein